MRRLALTILVAVSALAARPAIAHAILMTSDPAAGATVRPGPAHIVLHFNSRIDQARSRLELRAAGLAPAVLPMDPSGADALAADATLAPGTYTLRWQVLAVDGHITRGDVPLTVKAP